MSVSELVQSIKQSIEDDPFYTGLWVEGEVSTLRQTAAGHLFFVLKDETAQLRAVCFARVAKTLPFGLEDGMHVLVQGNVAVYEASGQVQILIDAVEPYGAGAAFLALEQRRKRLAQEGLFDAQNKRPIPRAARRIALITSAQGRAVHDVVTTLQLESMGCEVWLYPIPVQGKEVASEVAEAIRRADRDGFGEVILLVRGGGSREDLSLFDEEAIVRAIASAKLPVVTGIGHDGDFSLADLAADLAVATPTAAAHAICADVPHLRQRYEQAADGLKRAASAQVNWARQRLDAKRWHLVAASPRGRLERDKQRFQTLRSALELAISWKLEQTRTRLQNNQMWLSRLSPAAPHGELEEAHQRVAALRNQLAEAQAQLLMQREERVVAQMTALEELSPLHVMERGFAIVRQKGQVVRRASAVDRSQTLTIQFHDGTIDVKVHQREPSTDD
ncbi:MAG: exodeoxyribonuclease VII large subunit [Firmicutes bacterium]|nr:exodeoxyribonuclease VII large subunit [Bacillota bacterium]